MLYCPKCYTQLVPSAKYCHECGSSVDVPLVICNKCDKKNPADATLCYGCGNPLHTINLDEPFRNHLNLQYDDLDELQEQLKTLFFDELQALIQQINPQNEGEYLRKAIVSSFNRTIERRTRQLAEKAITDFRTPNSNLNLLEKNIGSAIVGLVQHHIIHNCQDLNKTHIPENILRYEQTHFGNIRLPEMLNDYLDFSHEQRQIVYTDLQQMPAEKLKGAAVNFLFTSREEEIFFICDQSLFPSSSMKEGFAFTEFGMYWKAPLNKAQRVYYHNIQTLENKKDFLKINGHFFNVNPSMNVKILLLLEKLQGIYAI